ncbi:reverse transcriptase [Gossypium australe]|uniref:Reverse transcriptase n=1 Tax=Gossypium australe TaxID=47621 RepID=A0A5B6VPC1_9ROSI|nr:reverse transcriptase [Gossypium australe]
MDSLVQLGTLCDLKEYGRMRFRSLSKFNVALLAKQGWCILNYPDSILTKVLKAKHFTNTNFLNSELGQLPSYIWKSEWVAKGLLENRRGKQNCENSLSNGTSCELHGMEGGGL